MIYSELQTNFPPLFKAVGCVCVCEGHVLLLKRATDKSFPGYWGLPSGKVEDEEASLQAAVRELFEETGILLSAENLNQTQTYHVVRDEFSFIYVVYVYQARNFPNVKINHHEHSKFEWFTLNNALRLDLVPESDTCLRDVFSSLEPEPVQLDLFTGLPSVSILPTQTIEQSTPKTLLELEYPISQKMNRPIFISLGPPSAGKTTVFKGMLRSNPRLKFVYDNTALRKSSFLNYYLRKAFLEEDRSFFFHFQVESLYLRFKYTFNAENFSLIDESIYTALAYSRALYRLKWLKEYEYRIFYNYYSMCFSLLPKPDAIFYITCSNDIIMKRLKRRSRKHESYYSNEYVDAMNFAFSETALELATEYDFNVISVDSGEISAKQIVAQFNKVVEKYEASYPD